MPSPPFFSFVNRVLGACAMDFIPKKRDKEAVLADPPIHGPTKTEFILDLRIAKALGLTIPARWV
jgi:hypothetical protein